MSQSTIETSNSCCSWKITLTLLGLIQILLIIKFFSHTNTWGSSPLQLVSKTVNNINVHIQGIERDSLLYHGETGKSEAEDVSDYPLLYRALKRNGSVLNMHTYEMNRNTWEDEYPKSLNVTIDSRIIPNSIAIGLGITSRKTKWNNVEKIKTSFPFFKSLLPSFCATASNGFSYNFFLAYDKDDPFYTVTSNLFQFKTVFDTFVNKSCLSKSSYSLHFVTCSHRKQPARAQNDAMMAAYMSNMEYYYRVNDDTKMKTKGWTEAFIKTLRNFAPPYVGVVGPMHRGGNTAILTYDFVHYSHIHIHGFYYPRALTDWYADRWITDVYQPKRCVKLKKVHLDHTLEMGQRYSAHYAIGKSKLKELITRGIQAINRYVQFLKKNSTKSLIMDSRNTFDSDVKVLSFSLVGRNSKYTYGVIRNAQLWPVVCPRWRFRVYVLNPKEVYASNNDTHTTVSELVVPKQITDKLKLLGADIVYLNSSFIDIPSSLWKYVVADDETVDYFLVRKSDRRLSEKDFVLAASWIKNNASHLPLFSIMDRVEHTDKVMVDGLFGARVSRLRDMLHTGNWTSNSNKVTSNIDSMTSLLFSLKKSFNITFAKNSAMYSSKEEYEFLDQVIWPKFNQSIFGYKATSI